MNNLESLEVKAQDLANLSKLKLESKKAPHCEGICMP